jgi:hypothetical protein
MSEQRHNSNCKPNISNLDKRHGIIDTLNNFCKDVDRYTYSLPRTLLGVSCNNLIQSTLSLTQSVGELRQVCSDSLVKEYYGLSPKLDQPDNPLAMDRRGIKHPASQEPLKILDSMDKFSMSLDSYLQMTDEAFDKEIEDKMKVVDPLVSSKEYSNIYELFSVDSCMARHLEMPRLQPVSSVTLGNHSSTMTNLLAIDDEVERDRSELNLLKRLQLEEPVVSRVDPIAYNGHKACYPTPSIRSQIKIDSGKNSVRAQQHCDPMLMRPLN